MIKPETKQIDPQQLNYRWALGGPINDGSGKILVEVYNEIERCIEGALDMPQLPGNHKSRWGAIHRMIEDITINGIINPLIVLNDKRMLTLVGNQRLCAARALGWGTVPVWMVDGLGEDMQLKQQFYQTVK